MCEESNKYFQDLGQLMEVKEQLSVLIHRPTQQHHLLYQELQKALYQISEQQTSFQFINKLLTMIKELQEAHDSEETNKIYMAELSVKLIDYVVEMSHQQEQKVNNYQGYIEQLTAEIQYLQKKNSNIEVDVQDFREQLRMAQGEGVEGCWEKSSQAVSMTGRDHQIWELEEQLQRVRQQLSCYTFRTASKKSLQKLTDKTLQMNRSQPYFEPVSAGLVLEHETNQPQEIDQLKNKITDLEYENYMLRIDMDRMKGEILEQAKTIAINPEFQTEEHRSVIDKESLCRIKSTKKMENSIDGNLCSYDSITCLSNNAVNQSSFKKLFGEQSTKQFKTLSKQWSSKQIFQGQVGYQEQLKQLVFLEEIQGLPDTGNTEQSQADENITYDNTATNTESVEADTRKECWCEQLSQKWKILTRPYFNLQERIVTSRIKTTFSPK